MIRYTETAEVTVKNWATAKELLNDEGDLFTSNHDEKVINEDIELSEDQVEHINPGE